MGMCAYAEIHLIRGIPPAAQDDAAARQDDALVRPEIILVDLVEIVHEMLHKRDALPAWDASLRRKRVEPTDGIEVVVEVFAVAYELDVLERSRVIANLLGLAPALCSERWLGVSQ